MEFENLENEEIHVEDIQNEEATIGVESESSSSSVDEWEAVESEYAPTADVVIEEVSSIEMLQDSTIEMEQTQFNFVEEDESVILEKLNLDYEKLSGAIETIIFMSDRPISITKIRDVISLTLPLRTIHNAIIKLQEEYEAKHHGIRLLEIADGYQFRTKAIFSKYVQDLFKVTSLVLSPSAIEVLAIIAYKQPVSRPDIDKIRGVDSSHLIRLLMDKRLIKFVGKSDDLGKPALYGTTQEFLEVFNLADLSELPPETELETMAQTTVSKISDIRDICANDDKKKFFFDEIDELDALSENIKSINADTIFTKSLKIEEKERLTTEGHVAKSAFDILEECLIKTDITEQNKDSIRSELLNPQEVCPSIVSNIEERSTESVINSISSSGDALLNVDEAQLEAAIDLAFNNLTQDQTIDSIWKEPVSLLQDNEELNDDLVTHNEDKLNHVTDDLIASASEFDLDLSFMQCKKDQFDDLFDDK